MAPQLVVGIGELLWDCFGDERRPGGAPANVAFHAGQFGLDAVICSRVGNDPLGDDLVGHLEARGLSTIAVQRDATHATGTVTVDASRPDHPAYTIHEDVAWDHIAVDNTNLALATRSSVVCFGTLGQRSATSRATIGRVLSGAGRATLVYDVNLRPPFLSRECIENSLQRCHVAKLNEDEVHRLGETLGLGATDMTASARTLLERYDLRAVFVTRGSQGCLAVSKSRKVEVPGCEVDVVDAVGAGDAFTAAMIAGLLKEWSLPKVARFANEIGALVATQRGAMPDMRATFKQVLENYAGIS